MISGPKILLELVLLIGIIIVLNKEGWKIENTKFLYVFTFISLILNIIFYTFGAWPLYVSFGEQQGISNQDLIGYVIFDILKWTILVYFITQFALKVEGKIRGGGFIITQKKFPVLRSIPIGIAAGIFMVIVVYGIMYLLFKDGLFEKLNQMRQSDLYLNLEIKKRGVPHDPETVRRQLRVPGPSQATLLLTRVSGQATALLARRMNR